MRIDPSFSDANWISMGGVFGANGQPVGGTPTGAVEPTALTIFNCMVPA